MSARLILPKRFTPILTKREKIIFLAGPVRGAGDWQAHAIERIAAHCGDPAIVCPCRYPPIHPLNTYVVSGIEDVFESQTLWERYYLELASKRGTIMFWLACEDKEYPRDPNDGPYARETYGELGEWRMRMKYDHARVVVGADPKFPGLTQIKRNFGAVHGKDFPLYSSLDATVDAALARAYRK